VAVRINQHEALFRALFCREQWSGRGFSTPACHRDTT
jgi:hypothetical protein